ncbi:phosphomannomutase CpsG [Planctobacterium marinum]|uniref:phosphomannomutase n=1 Tax=Planctobacterium marinum TaxID=1631968 RepID=A0AA48KVN9_9ALTE|nr:phosphomannomutase [Planctobacterium marinum]
MNCFKKYDVRGVVDIELTEDISKRIGAALAAVTHAQTAVVGCDARASSPRLKKAMIDGLLASGVDVMDLGQTGTEEIYFACQHLNCDVGVEITASHNPIEFNGIKFVGKDSKPFSESEFEQIKQQTINGQPQMHQKGGRYRTFDHMNAYVDCLLSHIATENIKPLRLVVNPGNGVAGRVIDAIEQRFLALQVPITFVKIFYEPDSEFPNGIPNPLLPEDRWKTANAVKESRADMGIAWDGDFDRCFLFDENGRFIDGYYIVGLLAQSFLADNPGQKVVHDPRVFWNTAHIVERCHGEVVKSQTGHALIKAKMRSCDAIYGGEMSAHHYFKSFAYCDSGMIPWLLVVKLLSERDQKISEIVSVMQTQFPSSGELNFRVSNSGDTLQRVQRYYEKSAHQIDYFDGLSMQFERWRFNLRSSATEPLLRLNIETRGDSSLLESKTKELTSLIKFN